MNSQIKKPQTFLLFLLISFPSFVAVLISAALPKIGSDFGLSRGYAQQLITVFIIGYAIAQLIYSPFANRFGRKPACYFGLLLYIIGCFVAIAGVMSKNLPILFVGRFITALGSSVGLTLSYTMINDYYPPGERRSIVGYVSLSYAIMPSIAVLIGGLLTTYVCWEACFYFLLLYSAVIAVVIFFLPETLPHKNPQALQNKALWNAYMGAFTNSKLVTFSILSGLTSAYSYITISESPFIGIIEIGLSASVYGFLMLLPYIGQVIGSLSAAEMSQYFTPYRFLKIALGFILVGSVMMFVSFSLHWVTVASLLISLFIIMIGLPITYSNDSLLALLDFDDRATGCSVMTFIVMLPTVFMLIARAFISIDTPLVMPAAFLILMVLVYGVFFFATKHFKEPKA